MTESIAQEVLKGLRHPRKFISSKFLYDEKGSRLFEKITAMPSYYLYDAEHEILKNHGKDILKALPFNGPFSIVEFGAGDGSKTIELLKQLRPAHLFDQYIPVDISAGANGTLASLIAEALPEVSVDPVQGNYFENMESLIPQNQPVLLLYLGSNIGNFNDEMILSLLMDFGRYLKPGDAIMIGFDLRKNPLTIRRAYDDPEGITRKFNMNLLTRFNRELGADFDLGQFDFYSCYFPETGQVRSYLISLEYQDVYFRESDQTVSFTKNELIHTEISRKFDLQEIRGLLSKSGFNEIGHWQDSNEYFMDVMAVRT